MFKEYFLSFQGATAYKSEVLVLRTYEGGVCAVGTNAPFIAVVANDLFGDADDISDSDEEAGGSGRKSPASGSDDEGPAKTKARRDHVISDDDDDVRRGSDLEQEHRSKSRSPEHAVSITMIGRWEGGICEQL